MRRIVIFGATSAIALEASHLFARDGDSLLLVGRNAGKLETVREDLLVRGAKEVFSIQSDLAAIGEHDHLFAEIERVFPQYDHVLIAYGSLLNQAKCCRNYEYAEREIRTNFLSVVSLLTVVARRFEERRAGTIAVITSVAGDRGRKSNYVYGSAKGALSLFLGGLRNRLSGAGVSVVTIKPGFVDTPMTDGMKKGFLFASPEAVGSGVYRAIIKQRDVVYLPWFWRWIMLVVRLIPEPIFKRLNV